MQLGQRAEREGERGAPCLVIRQREGNTDRSPDTGDNWRVLACLFGPGLVSNWMPLQGPQRLYKSNTRCTANQLLKTGSAKTVSFSGLFNYFQSFKNQVGEGTGELAH